MKTKIQLKQRWGETELYVNDTIVEGYDTKTQIEIFHKIIDYLGKCDKTSQIRNRLYDMLISLSLMLSAEVFDENGDYSFISELELD